MNKQQAIEQLWQTCFHDSEAFIRLYFSHKYKDANALLHTENGQPLAALLMLPYPMRWAGCQLTTAYISGACTLPHARNCGRMGNLLRKAFSILFQREIALSTLIPADEGLFGYYARFGYAPVFEYSQQTILPPPAPTTEGTAAIPETYDEDFLRTLFPYFQYANGRRSCSVLHPWEDFRALAQELYLSGGRIAATYVGRSPHPTGIAFALPQENSLLVKELLCENDEAQCRLLNALASVWQPAEIILRTPPTIAPQPYGMARIIHPRPLLRHLAQLCPTVTLTLRISDPLLPANNTTYLLDHGTCTRLTHASPDLETDITTLTQALLGSHPTLLPSPLAEAIRTPKPYMNLMMD